MNIDNSTKMSILFDYYGQLLSEKQRRIFKLYHEDNLSLAEIGAELGVSKQGIHDALKKAENILEKYEKKLALVNYSQKNEKLVNSIKEMLNEFSKYVKIDVEQKKQIDKIVKNIDELKI